MGKSIKLPSFENHFGLLIEQISIVVQKKVLNDLKQRGIQINFSEFLMLLMLASNDEGLSQKQISEKLLKDKAMVTRFVNHLETLQLVTRKQSQEDGRSYKVSVTTKGLRMVQSLDEIMVPFENRFIQSISKSDFLVFNSVLAKLLDHAKKSLNP
ncbi:MAG: MarR family transcriptional regulator [Pseudomonadota bacterium]